MPRPMAISIIFRRTIFVGFILGTVEGMRMSIIGMVSLIMSLVGSAVSLVLIGVLIFSPLEMTWPFFVTFIFFR